MFNAPNKCVSEIGINRFWSVADYKGWGINALCFVYNLNKPLRDRLVPGELSDLINSGKLPLSDFMYLWYVINDCEFVF